MKIGLLGHPLNKSLSKHLYSSIYEITKFKTDFYEFETQNPFDAIMNMINNGFNGFFVTIPYKKIFIEKTINDEIVRKTSNLNCVCIKNRNLFSTNTDYTALKKLLSMKGIDVANKNAVIIGNGSAALTSIELLKEKGIRRIMILSRNSEKNIELLKLYGGLFSFGLIHDTNCISSDILINATPLGMYYDFPEVKIDAKVTIDFAYLNKETKLIKIAKDISAKFIDGREILTMQGILGLKHIFGVDYVDRYYDIYDKFINVIREDS